MQSVKDREFLYSLMICGLLSALNCSPYIIGFQRSCDRYITILLAFMVLPTMLIYQKMVTKLDILYLDNNRYTTRPTAGHNGANLQMDRQIGMTKELY